MDILGMLHGFSPMGHEDSQRHHEEIYQTQYVQPHHKASWTHEAISGAAGFAAMHAYESHLRATGHEPTHAVMKEMLAAIAAAEVDKLVETKGLDWIDAHKAKKMAAKQAHHLAEHRYQGGTGHEYARSRQGPSMEYNYGGGAPFIVAPYGGGGYPGGAYEQYPGGGYPAQGGYPAPGGYGPPGGGYPAPGGYGPPGGGYQQYPPPQGYYQPDPGYGGGRY